MMMKIIRTSLKWLGLSLGGLIVLGVLAGLTYRLTTSPPQPPGRLVELDDFKLHINSQGPKNARPTIVLETGLALPGEHYHWLAEGLKDSLRVVRYDRAGIAYSERSGTPRDPETIAQELHDLLEKSGESPPYIMVGHSIGGLLIRVFTQQYPDEVAAMVFLDSSHPDQRRRMNYSEPRNVGWMLSAVALLGDIGILGLFDRLTGSILYVEEYPDEVNNRFYDYTKNGRYYRGFRKERDWSEAIFARAKTADNFEDLPILVFTANQRYDGTPAKPLWIALQKELVDLSTNGRHLLMNGHHNSIYTKKENADIICKEILAVARKIADHP